MCNFVENFFSCNLFSSFSCLSCSVSVCRVFLMNVVKSGSNYTTLRKVLWLFPFDVKYFPSPVHLLFYFVILPIFFNGYLLRNFLEFVCYSHEFSIDSNHSWNSKILAILNNLSALKSPSVLKCPWRKRYSNGACQLAS